ncbi:hypothetical protein D623_10032283 [Myotis brandtii]|uniref:Uncharacterized protein n=1 Tax=Myotis brandtii TaxID=109478 RepID=S7PKK2_MYOBR|nr:hypothetical protein D623_10032283 [Myotis brandtii]
MKEEVLQLVDEEVLGVMDEVRAKTGTKDIITIMIKDMKITIVPMVVIKTIVAMAAMIILGITMGTMNMDRNMQTTVTNRVLAPAASASSTRTRYQHQSRHSHPLPAPSASPDHLALIAQRRQQVRVVAASPDRP